MKKITVALLGAGERGAKAYASYALRHKQEIQFVAVAEPDNERRLKFMNDHQLSEDLCFNSWEELLEKPLLADAILICTQDKMHFHPAMKAMEKGYHVLLEKPMSTDPGECILMSEHARKYNRVLSICHVLRYTTFFGMLKEILESGKIGELVSIQHNENVAYWHQAHSFVRGSWANSKECSPMILAKCSHDMDILLWFAGAECLNISSFGSLTNFKKEKAPGNVPLRCLDGCPAEAECPYYAPNIYLTAKTDWPALSICNDPSIEARTKALMEGPYGRCVYHCDNDVVDHQVVNMEFANGVTAAFTLCAFTNECNRTIKLMGTKGEIRGSTEKNEIEITDFLSGNKEIVYLKKSEFGHGGGDNGIMRDFVRIVQADGAKAGLTSAQISVQSHMMAFAAEKSRVEKKVINIKEYYDKITADS